MIKVALMAVFVASLAGCYPITISDRCQRQIDSCLANCPQPQLDPTVGSPAQDNDYRSDCERRCHHVCSN